MNKVIILLILLIAFVFSFAKKLIKSESLGNKNIKRV